MSKLLPIKQVKLAVTHNKEESRAEWVFGYQKKGRVYAFYGCGYAFCYIDDAIIDAIFSPYKDLMSDQFRFWHSNKLLTKGSTWNNLGCINTYLSGIKDESTAIAISDWFEWLVSKVLASIPRDDLDRNLILSPNLEAVAIQKARDFSASIQDEAIERLYLIGSCGKPTKF